MFGHIAGNLSELRVNSEAVLEVEQPSRLYFQTADISVLADSLALVCSNIQPIAKRIHTAKVPAFPLFC